MMTEAKQLERELAYQAAKMDLENFCALAHQDGGWWYNLACIVSEPGSVERAVRYLELRQRLERNSLMPNLARPA